MPPNPETESPPTEEVAVATASQSSLGIILAVIKTVLNSKWGWTVVVALALTGGFTGVARVLGFEVQRANAGEEVSSAPVRPSPPVDYLTSDDLDKYVTSEKFEGHELLVETKFSNIEKTQDRMDKKLDRLLERE